MAHIAGSPPSDPVWPSGTLISVLRTPLAGGGRVHGARCTGRCTARTCVLRAAAGRGEEGRSGGSAAHESGRSDRPSGGTTSRAEPVSMNTVHQTPALVGHRLSAAVLSFRGIQHADYSGARCRIQGRFSGRTAVPGAFSAPGPHL